MTGRKLLALLPTILASQALCSTLFHSQLQGNSSHCSCGKQAAPMHTPPLSQPPPLLLPLPMMMMVAPDTLKPTPTPTTLCRAPHSVSLATLEAPLHSHGRPASRSPPRLLRSCCQAAATLL